MKPQLKNFENPKYRMITKSPLVPNTLTSSLELESIDLEKG